MKKIPELLKLAKRTALSAGIAFNKTNNSSIRKITGYQISGKEIKIAADLMLNKLIREKLKKSRMYAAFCH